jgi:hypothetical protein
MNAVHRARVLLVAGTALALVTNSPDLIGEQIRIQLEHANDARVKPRISASRFTIDIEVEGHVQKLEPTTIVIETQQKGRWADADLDAGRHLKVNFDNERPDKVRIETTLAFDLSEGERRFSQERDAILKAVSDRTDTQEGERYAKARAQLLLERIAAIREENIQAGADRHGRPTLHAPPLPRQALNFEKPEVLERLLKEQCSWKSVAQVFKLTGFALPEEKGRSDFAAAQTMAEEIRQAIMGNKITPRILSEGQFRALEQGSRYRLTARFIPELQGGPDTLWKLAPAVRLADDLIKRAALEGSLSRERNQVVAWWRVECDAPKRIQSQMVKGGGDCFWTWVETPDEHVRYLRVLLHSPQTRYRMNLSLAGASKGEELTLYDGPVTAPASGPL